MKVRVGVRDWIHVMIINKTIKLFKTLSDDTVMSSASWWYKLARLVRCLH